MSRIEPGPAILPLEFKSVGYRVGDQSLLEEVSFRLEAGPRTVILGPNGSGKSLTLRLAQGLLRPSSGRVAWRVENRLEQTMVFEQPVLLRRSARANVEYALALHGEPRGRRRERAREVLAQTGLESIADRRARVLSAGEQQRLALARAWAIRPQVLFLDEPTAALDPPATRRVEDLIREIGASGTKIVMTTHDLGQARRLAEDVLFFCAGRLLEVSPAADFFESPGSREGRAFLEGELSW
ncbi:MAG: ATP-binding cassette domain-containing protein [Myxococcota bacterium]|nr:ATP-binding cassette domain-containing protein [Myxococcota bacterium]